MTAPSDPCFDIAHLAHVELLTNLVEESLGFFVNVLGLTESGREAGPVQHLRNCDINMVLACRPVPNSDMFSTFNGS